ncbi:MAG: hypothetical protein ABI867_24300 [Kofleriaceae bacterium]
MRVLVLALVACTGVSPDPGLTAQLQVQGAQFRPGPFPADEGGPATLALATTHQTMLIGRFLDSFDGTLDPGARAAVFGIEGQDDAWLVTAGAPDFDTPGSPSAKARFGLAADFPPGPVTFVMAAADASGRFGPATRTDVIAALEPPPDGELVIELAWQGRADLDLHVIDALGGEAWSDDPNTFDPPIGEPVDPLEFRNHGILDHDGNKDCRRDAHPTEHVVWTVPPPPGDYVVRVDTPAMCGDPSAVWYVAAYRKQLDGTLLLLGSATGVATQDDVLQPRGRGAGVTALRFAL